MRVSGKPTPQVALPANVRSVHRTTPGNRVDARHITGELRQVEIQSSSAPVLHLEGRGRLVKYEKPVREKGA